ncbi:MAG: hypothetical protein O7A69_11915 [SAR324 cluster bacterium]|nr:hypothetical protein [SAR324 cluster bacterium]
MQRIVIAAACMLAMLLFAGSAHAGGDDGLGLAFGSAYSEYLETGQKSDSSGSSVTLDYQIVLGGSFSVNPFITRTNEHDRLPGSGNAFTAKSTVEALQFRLWFGQLFLGVHQGHYKLVRKVGENPPETFADTGAGAAIGYEGAGGFFAIAQYDKVSYALNAGDKFVSESLRAQIGYRF